MATSCSASANDETNSGAAAVRPTRSGDDVHSAVADPAVAVATAKAAGAPGRPATMLIVGGAGHQGRLYMNHVRTRTDVVITGVVVSTRPVELPPDSSASVYTSLEDALASSAFDVVVLSLPHALHDWATRACLDAGVKIVIKEKPLACTALQGQEYAEIVSASSFSSVCGVRPSQQIVTLAQRSVWPVVVDLQAALPRVGSLLSFVYQYHFALPTETTGWRAQRASALGGALLDMGYHVLEVVVRIFGMPTAVRTRRAFRHAGMRAEDLEDAAVVDLDYYDGSLHGQVHINRHADRKTELLTVVGTDGRLEMTRDGVMFSRTTAAAHPSETDNNINDDDPLAAATVETPATATSEALARACALSKEQQVQALFDHALLPKFAEWREQAFARNVLTCQLVDLAFKHSVVVEWQELNRHNDTDGGRDESDV